MTESKQSRIESDLARAKGLGSAHHGTQHWMHQRLTALAAVPLVLWLIWAVANRVVGASYGEFTDWLGAPHNAVLMILSIITIFYHAALGTQVIVEDYIHGALKWWGLIKIRLYFTAAAAACIFAVLKIAFMG